MKTLFIIISFCFILSCSTNKIVYWCGDHQCINKKEKENYFKKTMIVEVKDLSKIKESKSEIEKIKLQAKKDQKSRKKLEKELKKRELKAEKTRIKNEKDAEKQLRKDEKQIIKLEKKTSKKNSRKPKAEINLGVAKIEINNNSFIDLVNKIKNKNVLKPYPDINSVPE